MEFKERVYRADNVECTFFKKDDGKTPFGSLFVRIRIEIEGGKIIQETVDGDTWNCLRNILFFVEARQKKNLFGMNVGM